MSSLNSAYSKKTLIVIFIASATYTTASDSKKPSMTQNTNLYKRASCPQMLSTSQLKENINNEFPQQIPEEALEFVLSAYNKTAYENYTNASKIRELEHKLTQQAEQITNHPTMNTQPPIWPHIALIVTSTATVFLSFLLYLEKRKK